METKVTRISLLRKTKDMLITEYLLKLEEISNLQKEFSSLQNQYDELNIDFSNYRNLNENYKEEYERECDESFSNYVNYRNKIDVYKSISIVCFLLMIVSILVHIL